MTEQDILQLRDLAEAGQVQFKERILSKDDKYEIGCEMVAFSKSRGGRLIIGINDKEITHSSNEFVITIPCKVDLALSGTDPVSDQPQYNTPKLKLSKKQQDIRYYCSIPRNRQEIYSGLA